MEVFLPALLPWLGDFPPVSKKADAELAALRAEVEMLRTEVAALKAVPWWQQPGGGQWTMPGCTCGQTQGCAQHPRSWIGNVWCNLPANACAGAAGVPQVITIDPQAGPLNFTRDLTFGAAGCAPVQAFWVNV